MIVRDIYKKDEEMALSIEDLVMLIIGVVVFVLAFTDVRTKTNIVWISFLVIVLFIVAWGLVRFRRRPLPKQVHFKRSMNLLPVKIIRNYHLLAIIIEYAFILFRYVPITTNEAIISIIFHFFAVFILMLIEFIGNVIVSDTLEVFVKLEGEEEWEFKKSRQNILFGTRFYIFTIITGLVGLGLTYLPIRSLFDVEILSMKIVLLVMQFVALLGSGALFIFVFNKTINFGKLKDPSQILKAVDYYNAMELDDRSLVLLNDYIETDPLNVAILSKLSILYVKRGDYDKVLKYTGKVLAQIEEKQLNVPHMSSRAHLLRAISLKTKEKYKEAYTEVTQSLTITPENNAARKLRRDLRRILKSKKSEK
ncbi:MAG: hypothetical protein ACTSQF_01010 [Candidatus Heimdallarchaeaceae archaeon]